MWNELEMYRNNFLQVELPHIHAEPINQMVAAEMKKIQSKRRKHLDMDLQCEHSTYFDDRAELAYGFFALPKLMHEMNSFDEKTQWRAINSLSEYLQNPLHAQMALQEMDIIRLAQNTFLRYKHHYRTPYKNEIGRLLQIFNLLSVYLNGANLIARRGLLMEDLYMIIYNREEEHMDVAAEILQNISEKPQVLLYLIECEIPFTNVTKIFHKDVCCPDYPHALWMHLSHFLEVDPLRAIENGFFELLHTRIKGRIVHFNEMSMKCFALLLRCEEGQRRFDKIDGIKLMHGILKGKHVSTYEYIALAILNGLVSKRALWRSREFTDLPDILLHIAQESDNCNMQLYCLKALRLLGEMPSTKRYMRIVCLDRLWRIVCLNKLNECTRDEVARWLSRDIYESSVATKVD